MPYAYSELYLDDAMKCLGSAFDYALDECNQEPEWFTDMFIHSQFAKQFERGNPSVVSGMSGIELATAVMWTAYGDSIMPKPERKVGYSPFYWAGWALTYYQWKSGRRFRDIFKRMPLRNILDRYPLFHEMDVERFCDEMDRCLQNAQGETRLKHIRQVSGLSQAELARRARVGLRSIQMYEQRVNDIDKAQANTLYRLACALGCDIEDLLEAPAA